MRILSTSGDIEEEKTSGLPLPKSQSGSLKSGFLNAFRSRDQNAGANNREAGMEQSLLSKIEGKDIKMQMNAFYTAYSKVIVPRFLVASLLTSSIVHRRQI